MKTIKRLFYKADLKDVNDTLVQKRMPVPEEEANLVSSFVDGEHWQGHAPVIDLDFPCRLVESSTPGHFHLYMDRRISWERYKAVLKAMCDAGLVERGFYELSLARGATFVRKPGVMKEPDDVNSATGISFLV